MLTFNFKSDIIGYLKIGVIMNILVVYTTKSGEHLHTWETSLPVRLDDIEEAVYSTGLVENDDVTWTVVKDEA